MSNEDNVYEQIDRFLNGELSEGEKAAFESRLQADEEFSRVFEAQKIAHRIVIGKELLALKAQMTKDLGGKSTTSSPNRMWKYVAGGAAVIAVAVLLYLLFKQHRKPDKMHTPVVGHYPKTTPVLPAPVPDTTGDRAEVNQETETLGREVKVPEIKEPERTCSDTLISFSCQAKASCVNDHNGAIEVDLNTIKAGKAPYSFSVYRDRDFVIGDGIRDLKAGRYDLFVKDARGCLRKLNVKVEVPEVNCAQGHK